MDGVRHRHAAFQPCHHAGHIWYRETSACASTEPAAFGRCSSRPCCEYRCLVHHEHKLAVVRSRDDDELSDSDAYSRLSQLLLGGCWYCTGYCTGPRDLTS